MTTTFDFGYGPVPAHQHTNGGGWVADSAAVDDSAYVGPNALVYGNAQVYGNARVSGEARVYGKALVSGKARVSGNALVSGEARVYGNARVSGKARVYDKAQVYGEARVYGEAWVYGKAYLHFGNGVTPSIASGDLWMNSDGTETVRLGCWAGTIGELRALADSDSWPSGGDADYRDRWRPSLLALADLCEAHLATWSEARKG